MQAHALDIPCVINGYRVNGNIFVSRARRNACGRNAILLCEMNEARTWGAGGVLAKAALSLGGRGRREAET